MVNPFYIHQVLNNPKYTQTLEDFNIWYKPCKKCGFNVGKSTSSTCWKCGRKLRRDFSTRALKKTEEEE